MKKILVVEDSATMRHLIRMYLRNIQGVTLVEARDGLEAMEKIKESHYDLLMTDINMPRMDGLQLIKSVRTMGIKIPIIVLTTRGEEPDVERGMELGADSYITKPVVGPALSNAIMDYIGAAA